MGVESARGAGSRHLAAGVDANAYAAGPAEGAEVAHAGRRIPQEGAGGAAAISRHLAAGVDAAASAGVPAGEGAEVAHAGRRVPHERTEESACGAGSRYLSASVDV